MKPYQLFFIAFVFAIAVLACSDTPSSKTAQTASAPTNEAIIERGLELTQKTKAVLGKNLLGAINEKGTDGALAFCNIQAHPLTDSMAMQLGASIRRVSDQARNPQNIANDQELAYITKSKALLAKGETAPPQVQKIANKTVGYYPIVTNQMCLQCHGTPHKDIQPSTLTKLSELYPKDQATGYDVGQLRGIWVVEME